MPGGPIGAKPIGTIAASGKIKIAANHSFETRGTQWCITKTPPSGGGADEPVGCRGTVGNANIGDGRVPGIHTSSDAAGNKVVVSVFRGDARRVLYTDGSRFYEAKLYRLAGVPGWMMSVVAYDAPKGDALAPGDAYVFAYNAEGKVMAQFPLVKDGGPRTNPLR
ncbi:hypothetical protein [Kribbella sancticallisti]